MANSTCFSRLVPPGLCFLLLIIHGCLAQLQPCQQPQSPRLSGRSDCQIDRITAREPNRRQVSEAGYSEFWDSGENDELECAGVEVVRHTINPKGLLLPYYPNTHELVYVIRGRGLQGTVLTGCPETFETSYPLGGGREQFVDKHQKVYRFKEGDILALPAGSVHWTYNDGDTPIIVINLRDTSNVANQLDRNFRKFFLAGNPQSQRQEQGGQYPWGRPSQGPWGTGQSQGRPGQGQGTGPYYRPGQGSSPFGRPGQGQGTTTGPYYHPGQESRREPWGTSPSYQPGQGTEPYEPWGTGPSYRPGQGTGPSYHPGQKTGPSYRPGQETEPFEPWGTSPSYRPGQGSGSSYRPSQSAGGGTGPSYHPSQETSPSYRPRQETGPSYRPGQVTEPSEPWGTGPSYRPGQGSGTSYRPGQGSGTSYRPGQGTGPSGQKTGPSYRPGQGTEPFEPWGTSPSYRPGPGSGTSYRPGQETGTSYRPGQGTDPSYRPGQGTEPFEPWGTSPSYHPGQGGGSSYRPGQGSGSTYRPGQGQGQGTEPSYRPGQETEPWGTRPWGTSPSYHPGQGTGPSYHPGQGSEPSYHPGQETDPSYHPGQRTGPFERPWGTSSSEGRQDDPCAICRRIRGEVGLDEPCANCNEMGRQQVQEQEGFNMFSGFDNEILQEVFNVEYDTVWKLQGQNDDRGLIVHAENFQVVVPEEQEYEGRPLRVSGGNDRNNSIAQTICATQLNANIASPARADVYNPRGGRISRLNSHKLPILNQLQLSAERGILYKNAVLAPHYNLNAHSIVYVISGSSRLQIVRNDGSSVFDDVVREGQLIVVPQDFAVVKKAGEQGCEWVAFKTNDNAMTTQLAGRFSFIRALPEEVLVNSYDISREQAKNLKYNRQEGVVLSPARSSSGSTIKKTAKNALLNVLFG